MIRTLSLLLRGAVADNAQAIEDAHAVAILINKIEDAATERVLHEAVPTRI